MKLYTEEQVIKMIEKSRETGLTAEFLILTTAPIELPSDEEVLEAEPTAVEWMKQQVKSTFMLMFWFGLLGTFIYYPVQTTLGFLSGLVLWVVYFTIYVSLKKKSKKNKIQGGNK
jgi:L-asparagine transporter-like permease